MASRRPRARGRHVGMSKASQQSHAWKKVAAVLGSAAVFFSGIGAAWADDGGGSSPPPTQVVAADVGTVGADRSTPLVTPKELDGATVTEVLPVDKTDVKKDQAILVVEKPSTDAGSTQQATKVRVSTPKAGTLAVRAKVGDKLTTGDVLATIAAQPVAAVADPAPPQDPAPAPAPAAPVAKAPAPAAAPAPADDATTQQDDAATQPGADTQSGDGAQSGDDAQSGADVPATLPQSGVAGKVQTRDAEITPLAVGDSTIVVTKRTLAQPLGVNGSVGANTSSTVGATFQLYTYTNAAAGPQGPVSDDWAKCQIVAESPGQCTITVPDTQQGGTNYNKQFWVVETSPATGTYFNRILKVGSYEGPEVVRYYPGLTPRLTAGTYNMPADARTTTGAQAGTGAANDQERSFGAVADSLANPVVVPRCAASIDIALQLDMSPSIDATELGQYKTALTGTNGLLDSLAGTNSRVSLYNFNSTSPGESSPSGWNYQTPLNVDEGNNLATLKSRIDGLSTTGGATNWDRALRVVASAPTRPDVLIFITDGAPNYITGTGGGNTTAQPDSFNVAVRSVEAAIYSANAVKSLGTRILAVGVGGGITEAGENLRAVSGPEPSSDYFQTRNWGDLGTQLRAIAQSLTCQVPITVTKAVTNEAGSNPQPASGWQIKPTLTDTGAGSVSLSPNANARPTGDGNGGSTLGAVSWTAHFTDPAGTATIKAAEALQDGYQSLGGTYTVTHAGGGQTTGSFESIESADIAIAVGDSVEIAFVNKPFPRIGTFDLAKVLNNPDNVAGVPANFTITYQIGSGTPVPVVVPAGASSAPIEATAGSTVTVWETLPGAPTGTQWATPSWKVGGDTATPGGDGKVTFTVAGGAHVSVQVTNSIAKKTVPLEIEKVVTGPGASLVPPGTVFDVKYFVNGATEPTGLVTLTFGGGKQQITGLKHGDTVTFEEVTPLPAVSGVDWGTPSINPSSVTINAEATALQLVTVTNTANIARVSVAKSDGTVTQLANGNWQVDYTITVKNETKTATTYTLSDAPALGTGFTEVSKAWQGDTPAPDTPIAAGATHTYTYRVVASFDPEVANPQLTCNPQTGGAFFNRASITFPGGTDSDTGCGEPASPTVTKTAAAATQDPTTGNWTVKYDVKVTNGSGIQLAYTLTDTAAALPAGVTPVGGWSVTGPVKVPADAGSATPNASWNGTGTLATGLLPKGATHTFTVSRVVTVTASANPGNLKCSSTPGQGGGLWNSATVTNGVGTDSDQDCTTIEVPKVDVAKKVVSTVQGVDGKWTVVYDVVVSNASDLTAVYSLSDTLHFGGGISVVSASWSGAGSGVFASGETSAVLATDRALLAKSSHTFTVSVVSLVDPAAWGSSGSQLACPPGEDGVGGFLNSATVTFPGGSDTAQDCSEPSLPSIVKDFVSSTQSDTDASRWTVVYLVRVTGGDHDTFYDLSDVPSFAEGVDVVSGSAQRTDTVPVGEAVELAPGSGKIATGVALAAGAEHTYRVAWLVDIPRPVADEVATCGQTPSEGHGFFNEAVLSVGGVDINDDACGDIDEFVVPRVEKDVTSTKQNRDGTWTIVYSVTVTLPTDAADNPKGLGAKYDLVDTLDFGEGLDVIRAGWTGPGGASGGFDLASGQATLAQGVTITPGSTPHVYVVTVDADVTTAAVEDNTLECRSPGEGASGGFLNTVRLTSGGTTGEDTACSEPAIPTIEKTGQEAEQDDDGVWDVSYLVTVTNPDSSDHAVVYRLTDTPADLPDGVDLVEGTTWTASAAEDGTPDPDQESRPADGRWVISEGTLEPGESHVYLISARVTVASETTFEFDRCRDVGATGIVLPNLATIRSGGYRADDKGCTVVEPPPSWVLSKSSEPPSGSTVAAGSTITYTLTVTNTGQVPVEGALVEDDLSEVLAHAAIEGDLDESLELDGTTLTWTLPDVDVDDSVSVSYTVRVDAKAAGVTLHNVATPASEGGTCLLDRCATTHDVPAPVVPPPVHPGMPRTGSDAEAILMLALASLAAGATLVSRRRWSVRNR